MYSYEQLKSDICDVLTELGVTSGVDRVGFAEVEAGFLAKTGFDLLDCLRSRSKALEDIVRDLNSLNPDTQITILMQQSDGSRKFNNFELRVHHPPPTSLPMSSTPVPVPLMSVPVYGMPSSVNPPPGIPGGQIYRMAPPPGLPGISSPMMQWPAVQYHAPGTGPVMYPPMSRQPYMQNIQQQVSLPSTSQQPQPATLSVKQIYDRILECLEKCPKGKTYWSLSEAILKPGEKLHPHAEKDFLAFVNGAADSEELPISVTRNIVSHLKFGSIHTSASPSIASDNFQKQAPPQMWTDTAQAQFGDEVEPSSGREDFDDDEEIPLSEEENVLTDEERRAANIECLQAFGDDVDNLGELVYFLQMVHKEMPTIFFKSWEKDLEAVIHGTFNFKHFGLFAMGDLITKGFLVPVDIREFGHMQLRVAPCIVHAEVTIIMDRNLAQVVSHLNGLKGKHSEVDELKDALGLDRNDVFNMVMENNILRWVQKDISLKEHVLYMVERL